MITQKKRFMEFPLGIDLMEASHQSSEIGSICEGISALNSAAWHFHESIRFFLLRKCEKCVISVKRDLDLYQIAYLLYSGTMDDVFLDVCRLLKSIAIYQKSMTPGDNGRLPYIDIREIDEIKNVQSSVFKMIGGY